MHHIKKRYLYSLAILIAVMATVLVSQGRVFLRWGAAAQSLKTMESLGGTAAYESSVAVNGGSGQLTVFRFDQLLREVVRNLSRTFAIPNFTYGGGSMGYGSVTADGKVLRFVAIRIEEQGKTVVFLIEQSEEDARQSKLAPAASMLSAVPSYPESKPVFFASDGNAGMSMEISRVRTDEESVRQFFATALPGAGWTYAFDPAPNANVSTVTAAGGPSLKVYLKKQEVCCVLVDASDVANETRITVLHKRHGLK